MIEESYENGVDIGYIQTYVKQGHLSLAILAQKRNYVTK